MQAELEEVLALQDEWTAENTEAMKRRGDLIRNELPQQIGEILPDLQAVDPTLSDGAIEGRDGMAKSELPWTRFYSASRSPSATKGWYVVYLFSAHGDRLYVSLNQGTTRWENGFYKPRPPEQLAERVTWARDLLAFPDRQDLALDISLEARRTPLGPQYELGNVVSFAYERNDIPKESQLHSDLRTMAEWLATVYSADETELQVPGEPPPEIADASVAIRQAAGKARGTGQGFKLNAAEKLAIERHAVELVSKHYKEQDFKVSDVGSHQPFDLDIKGGTEHLSVEVKGTTSKGAQVILTDGEVKHHRKRYPNNALAIVHSIHLDRTVDPSVASGGQLHITSPWTIEDEDLSEIAYTYSTGL